MFVCLFVFSRGYLYLIWQILQGKDVICTLNCFCLFVLFSVFTQLVYLMFGHLLPTQLNSYSYKLKMKPKLLVLLRVNMHGLK